MKRAFKIIIITAASIIIVAAIAFCGYMAINHWDLSVIGNNKYQTRSVAIEEGFGNISIDCDTADVSFYPSEDGKCSVVFYEPKNETHIVRIEKDTLFITKTDTKKWYERIMFSSLKSPAVKMYLPQPTYAALIIKDSAGDITLPEGFTFESIDISTDTGNAVCCASATGLISVKSDTGSIRLKNVSAGELKLGVCAFCLLRGECGNKRSNWRNLSDRYFMQKHCFKRKHRRYYTGKRRCFGIRND